MVRRESFYFYDQGIKFSIWNWECTARDFICSVISEGVNITAKKIKGIEELLVKHYEDAWMESNALRFFVDLLYINVLPHEPTAEQNNENAEDAVDDPIMPKCCAAQEIPEWIV